MAEYKMTTKQSTKRPARRKPRRPICKKSSATSPAKNLGSSPSANGKPAAAICKKTRPTSKPKNLGLLPNGKSPAVLKRTTFRTSRAMDFFSKRELVTQTGYAVEHWPLVIVSELVDNALDASEEADIAPEITVSADAAGITITDNGPGLPESTIEGILDFQVRTSNREMYVAPDRGAQGNAGKCLAAMPRVIDPEHGRLVIKAKGVEHTIVCKADPVTQQPLVDHRTRPVTDEGGTFVRMEWAPDRADDGAIIWPFDPSSPPDQRGSTYYPSLRDSAMVLFWGYATFNPHLSLSVRWFQEQLEFAATDPTWRKWRPNRPTSPHWYEVRHLERLAGCYIALDRQRGQDRTVAAFLSEFDGLTGSAKRTKVTDETGLGRTNLSELADESGFKRDVMARLLGSMRKHSRPVKPVRLGIIGKDHFCTRFEQLGCEPDKVEYAKRANTDAGLPYVVESAFAWYGERGEGRRRMLLAGANWSPRIADPFRSFGSSGEGLDTLLAEQKATAERPVVFAIHAAHPRIEYTDRGKTAIVIGEEEEIDE